MDKRPEEVRHIGIMVDFLCDEYPKLFKKGEYAHPVLGVRRTLTIVETQQTFDIENIDKIEFDYSENRILIKVKFSSILIEIKHFIKDATVM